MSYALVREARDYLKEIRERDVSYIYTMDLIKRLATALEAAEKRAADFDLLAAECQEYERVHLELVDRAEKAEKRAEEAEGTLAGDTVIEIDEQGKVHGPPALVKQMTKISSEEEEQLRNELRMEKTAQDKLAALLPRIRALKPLVGILRRIDAKEVHQAVNSEDLASSIMIYLPHLETLLAEVEEPPR